MKVCIECATTKSLDDYYSHQEMADGHLGVCKDCHKARMKLRRLTNPAVQEYDRKRKVAAKRKTLKRTTMVRWRKEHPGAYRAHSTLNYAVRSGKIKKAPCALCGATKHVHGHHKDYSKPLDVTWLCAKCHHRLHAAFPELGGHHEVRA